MGNVPFPELPAPLLGGMQHPGSAGAAAATPAPAKHPVLGISPSPHSQDNIPVRAEAVGQNPWQRSLGQSAWDRNLPSSGWRHPCGAHGFSFGPAVPSHAPCLPSTLGWVSSAMMSCFHSIPSFGTALFCRVPGRAMHRAKVVRGFPCTQVVFAQENSAGSGSRLGQCREGSGWHGGGV